MQIYKPNYISVVAVRHYVLLLHRWLRQNLWYERIKQEYVKRKDFVNLTLSSALISIQNLFRNVLKRLTTNSSDGFFKSFILDGRLASSKMLWICSISESIVCENNTCVLLFVQVAGGTHCKQFPFPPFELIQICNACANGAADNSYGAFSIFEDKNCKVFVLVCCLSVWLVCARICYLWNEWNGLLMFYI